MLVILGGALVVHAPKALGEVLVLLGAGEAVSRVGDLLFKVSLVEAVPLFERYLFGVCFSDDFFLWYGYIAWRWKVLRYEFSLC